MRVKLEEPLHSADFWRSLELRIRILKICAFGHSGLLRRLVPSGFAFHSGLERRTRFPKDYCCFCALC